MIVPNNMENICPFTIKNILHNNMNVYTHCVICKCYWKYILWPIKYIYWPQYYIRKKNMIDSICIIHYCYIYFWRYGICDINHTLRRKNTMKTYFGHAILGTVRSRIILTHFLSWNYPRERETRDLEPCSRKIPSIYERASRALVTCL